MKSELERITARAEIAETREKMWREACEKNAKGWEEADERAFIAETKLREAEARIRQLEAAISYYKSQTEQTSTTYKGIEISVRLSGKYYLDSPYNGTTRVFKTLDEAKYYVDNYEALESHARAMARG